MTSKTYFFILLGINHLLTVAAITGATGFLGPYILDQLLDIYDEVRVLARDPNKVVPRVGISVIRGDITEEDTVGEEFLENVSCLFHVAAKVGSWPKDPNEGYIATNIDGTRMIIEKADQYNIPRIVYTSSYFALGATGTIPRDENWNAPPEFVHPYLTTKYAAGQLVDKMVEENHHPIVQINPTTVMGAGIDNVISDTIADFINGKLLGLPGGGENLLNFVSASDVALGHVLAKEKGRLGEKYIIGGQNMSLRELLLIFADRLGLELPRSIPYFLGKIYAFILELTGSPSFTRADISVAQRSYIYDISKARNELGFEPDPIENIIDLMLKDLVQSGKLNRKGESRVNQYFSTIV